MMDKAEHTSGPWVADVWDFTEATPPYKRLVIQSGKNRLAVLDCDYTGDNPYIIPQKEAEANARMIAATPDMLDALEMAIAWADENKANNPSGDPFLATEMGSRVRASIEAAIAKTKG